MTDLETWLVRATRQLSRDAGAQVRSEIQEHYELTREALISRGVSTDDADRLAVTALGDAKAANCQYRKVLLTSAEARLLREGNWEAGVVCSRLWLKWVLLATPVGALLAATTFFLAGAIAVARVLLIGGIGMGFCSRRPFCQFIPRPAAAFTGGLNGLC
jgi:hypothetical protein